MTRAETTEQFEARFWSKVRRTEGCWYWIAATNDRGYGQIGRAGRVLFAHRVAFELTFRPLEPGERVCHHCDAPPCVRPDHLFVGTQADNMEDMVLKGRSRRGEDHHFAKLTWAQVEDIRSRRAAGTPGVVLAADYGIHPNHVGDIVA